MLSFMRTPPSRERFHRRLDKRSARTAYSRREEREERAMDYIRVAGVKDVSPGQIVPIEAKGMRLLLANSGGAFYAAQRKCPHLGFNLCRGHLENGSVVCMLHKAKFNLATGRIDRDPKLLFINMKAKSDLATYPVKVEGEDILVGV
jgi:nitrite reductase/ring-hydroxylating ferredoxin subunit